MNYDVIIIGSGFGGSVAALRLSEKGYKVAVLEQGRRVSNDDKQDADKGLPHLLWLPELGFKKGFFYQRFFKHMTIVGGAGVGGGSLIYAAVLLEPRKEFYADPAWSHLGVDWESALRPHYQTAARMLGRTPAPKFAQMDWWLKETAEKMGAGHTFGPTLLGVYFGEEDVEKDDPFFNGEGPSRKGCLHCGNCLTGCPHNAKNSLDLNYLYLAEKHGAEILPEHKATLIRRDEPGYIVETVNPLTGETYPSLRAGKVVLAAGVLGTLELLFRCHQSKALDLSLRLGTQVRTNSEVIAGIFSPHAPTDVSKGVTIASHFYPDDETHITQNRFPKGYTFMKWYASPLVDEARPFVRALKTIWKYITHPRRNTDSLRAKDWHTQMSTLTVMQHADNMMALTWGRSLFTGYRLGLQSKILHGKRTPTYLPVANKTARIFGEVAQGIPGNTLLDTLLNMSVTAHILGGCPLGRDKTDSVIGVDHQVHGYEGLYVVDGSAIPANVGVNPSLTITALAERAMSLVASKV